MASMKDVAKLAEVSVMTVSRVINQSAPVDVHTRSRVEEAIKKLNYRPNLFAKRLREQDSEAARQHPPTYAVYESYREYARAGQPYPGEPGKGSTLGFANIGSLPFCIAVEQNILKQARLAGFSERDLFIMDNRYNTETALRNLEKMLAKTPDLFIEYQADVKVNSIVAAKFGEKGIPIIAVDIPVPGAPFMGINDWHVATMGGEYMTKLIRQKFGGWDTLDLVVLLQNQAGGEVTMLRSEGFATTLEEHFGEEAREKILRIDGGMGQVEEARVAMERVLRSQPDAKKIALTSMNEETMVGAIEAFQNADRWDPDNLVVITLGVDDLGKLQIRKSFSDAGVAFFPEKYGEYLIPAACAILEEAPVPSHMYVENVIITKENIDEFYPLL